MRLLSMVLGLCFFGASLGAETPLTGAEFDAYTSGRTITYTADGQAFGAETYLRRQRVRWSFLQGECQEGHWFADGSDICFVYENLEGPQCWQFFLTANGLRAEFVEGGSAPLFESTTEQELICLGPDVGM